MGIAGPMGSPNMTAAAGYAALTTGVGAVRLHRDVVRVSGPQAVAYLQGQLSQDVAALTPGASAWSLVLQPQGKVDAWVRVTVLGPEEVLLDVDGGFGAGLVARLERFKLRVKAEIEPLDWACVAVRGPAAEPGGTGLAVAFAWEGFIGFDLLGPDAAAPDGVEMVDEAAYEVRRIEAGLPRMGAELTDKTIPAEAGGVVAASVSFTKGCYTGQELVARIDSRGGNVPRNLRGLVLAGGELPVAGSVVEVDGKVGGTVTSVARHPDGHGVALGYMRRDVVVPGEATCAGVAVSVRPLPLR